MIGWLRRNAIALAVLAISVVGLVFVVLVFPTMERQQQVNVIEVAQGQSIDELGYSFALTRSQEFVGTGRGPDGNNIPLGSSLVGTIITITALEGAATDASCEITLTARSTGGDKTWTQVSDLEDFSYEVGDDRTEYCILDGDSIEVETVFLTPTGTYANATVDVGGIGNALSPTIYRFSLVN